jgi:hypothetical protein
MPSLSSFLVTLFGKIPSFSANSEIVQPSIYLLSDFLGET